MGLDMCDDTTLVRILADATMRRYFLQMSGKVSAEATTAEQLKTDGEFLAAGFGAEEDVVTRLQSIGLQRFDEIWAPMMAAHTAKLSRGVRRIVGKELTARRFFASVVDGVTPTRVYR